MRDVTNIEKSINAMKRLPGVLFTTIMIVTIMDLLLAFPIKWAWNYTMTYLFGLPTITWAHAFCLLYLLTMLWKITPIPTK